MMLRPLQREDREEFIRVHRVSARDFSLWSPAREGSLERWFDEDLERSEEGRESGTSLRLVGVLDDERIAGFFALTEVVRGAFHNAYAGWYVNSEVVGHGYATEGVGALLDLAFSAHALELHRVQANVIPANRASIRVAEKVGMRREGYAERYLRIGDVWQDHVMYAKTAEEHAFRYL